MNKESHLSAYLAGLAGGSLGWLFLLFYFGSFKVWLLSAVSTVILVYIFDRHIDKHEIVNNPADELMGPYFCFVCFFGAAIFFGAPYIDSAGYCGNLENYAKDASYLREDGKWIKDYEIVYFEEGCDSTDTNQGFLNIAIFGAIISLIIFLNKYRKLKK